MLPGYGDIGEALGRHNDVDAVSFTGSTEVGGYFMKYSGESNLKSVGLEMGGKSPFIVLEDAKINDSLIDNAINSAFWNGGQNCSANMRQIIHSKVKDEFLDKVSKRIKKIKVGDPLSADSNMGSMISKEHLAKVDEKSQESKRRTEDHPIQNCTLYLYSQQSNYRLASSEGTILRCYDTFHTHGLCHHNHCQDR